MVHLAAWWLQTGGNVVLAEGHGPFVAFGKYFIGTFLHSGWLPSCPSGEGSPRGAETSPRAGMRPSRGGRTFLCAARRFPRAGRTPGGCEGAASQRGIGRAPHCGTGRSPPAGKTCAPAGRRSPRGGTRSPRGPSMSPCSGWFPPGAKRSFPEGVRPFYGCKAGGRQRDLGRPHRLTLPESLASGLHHKGRDDVTMACYITADTRVDGSAPTP